MTDKVQTTPMNPMQALILDLAAAIEDPCGADEIRLARIAVNLLTRTPATKRVLFAEALELLYEIKNKPTITPEEEEDYQGQMINLATRIRNDELFSRRTKQGICPK